MWKRFDKWLIEVGLSRFNRWFTSAAGVLQTFAVILGFATFDILNPRFDPHGFWLLWALTVYSGATQPALAYANASDAEQIEHVITRLNTMEEEHGTMLAEIHRLTKDVHTVVTLEKKRK